jgi:hypothetical protein
MPAVIDQPSLTDVYEHAADFVPLQNSVYIHMPSPEERSVHIEAWRERASGVFFAEISEVSAFEISVKTARGDTRVYLRNRESLSSFWRELPNGVVYVDMTGLAHHVWAPLLRSSLEERLDVMFVYVEPEDYKHSGAPIEGQIFDLSEKIEGISPLPGFAYLGTAHELDTVFIPLLGFEGTRLAYLLEEVQPNNDRIIPIIGLPGFRPEYPFHTYLGNKRPLEQTQAWQRVRFATANCPFSLFYTLGEIASLNPRSVLQIAPIGTKPHALGAVIFKIISSRSVEIIYDFPLRKVGRTRGTDRLLVYYVSSFGG